MKNTEPMLPIKEIETIEAIKCRSEKGNHSKWNNIDRSLSAFIHSYLGNAKECYQVPNMRMFKCEYLPPTNYNGMRIKITESGRVTNEDTQSITFPKKCNDWDHVSEYCFNILKANELNPVCRSSDRSAVYFMVYDWGENRTELKDLKGV